MTLVCVYPPGGWDWEEMFFGVYLFYVIIVFGAHDFL